MGLGKLINRGLNRFGFHLQRAPQGLRERAGLSSELTEETEIFRDMTCFPDNDLKRLFSKNESQEVYKWHHYFEIYDQWFSRFRQKPDLRVLEIGVFRGGSLRMWREYFHKDATVVGLDIEPSCKAYENPDRKIFVEIGDQTDESFLRSVAEKRGPFDIVIDDGGHTTAQQTISFCQLYSRALNDNGVYLVEDTHSNYWPEFQDAGKSFIDFAKDLVDRLHEPYFDERSILRFQEGRAEQLGSMKVSRFCADTHSISFYDSIVVFEKRRKSLPVVEIR